MQATQWQPPYANLIELARYRAACQPQAKAFSFLRGGEKESAQLSFADLDTQARGIAARLQQHFKPGDRVVLAYAPGLEFISAFFGCLYAGVVAVLATPPSGTTEVARLKKIAAETGAAGLCMGQAGFNNAYLGLSSPEFQKSLLCLTTGDGSDGSLAEQWVPPEIDPAGAAFLQYTSGATGTPKGVMVSHANVLHNQRLIERALKNSNRTVALSWLPLHQDMGLIGHVVQPLYLGITSLLMSPAAFIAKPVSWLQAITDHRATVSGGPNFAYELCIRRITGEQMRTLDLSSWDVALNGAETVRIETLERFADKFAASGFRREAFLACYGLAEATLFVSGSQRSRFPTVLRLDADALQRGQVLLATARTPHVRSVVSCGRAPNLQISIVEPESRVPCAAGRVGEIWIGGGSVACGYDARAAPSSFRARLAGASEGAFLRTGDLGFVSEGDLYVTGRLQDLIVIGGRHFYPADIEDAVRASHPALKAGLAAAFTIESGGESRLIVLHEVHRHELRRLARADVEIAARTALLAEFGLHLEALTVMPEGGLPRTSSGKIRRSAARDAYAENMLTAAVAS